MADPADREMGQNRRPAEGPSFGEMVGLVCGSVGVAATGIVAAVAIIAAALHLVAAFDDGQSGGTSEAILVEVRFLRFLAIGLTAAWAATALAKRLKRR